MNARAIWKLCSRFLYHRKKIECKQEDSEFYLYKTGKTKGTVRTQNAVYVRIVFLCFEIFILVEKYFGRFLFTLNKIIFFLTMQWNWKDFAAIKFAKMVKKIIKRYNFWTSFILYNLLCIYFFFFCEFRVL